MCYCWEEKRRNQSIQYQKVDDSAISTYTCRWKYCLFWTILPSLIIILILLLVLFLSIIPHLAQTSTNDATLVLQYVRISNATNQSIDMNTTLTLYNTGSFKATIQSSKGHVYWENKLIGHMTLPEIDIKANEGANFNMITTLHISNVDVFKATTKILLSGKNVYWSIESKPTINLKFLGISVETDVNMKHSMLLEGLLLSNVQSRNFTVTSATSTHLQGIAELSFTTTSNIEFDVYNFTVEMYNEFQRYIGYAFMPHLLIQKGYNSYKNLPTYLEKKNNNEKDIYTFISNFMMAMDQTVYLQGPVSVNNQSTVIDNTMNQTATVEGLTTGDIAISGVMTSKSQIGWNISFNNGTNHTQIRGAYSNIKNPLIVPITLLDIIADLNLSESIAWTFSPFKFLNVYCPETTALAHLTSGFGMYQNNESKTTVELEANELASFFVIALPQDGQYTNKSEYPWCPGYAFSCCFASETLAAICRDNPQLKTEGSDAELLVDYIDTHLYSNMTVLIDGEFYAELTYNQEFFPVFYGSEVYTGYPGDLDANCGDIVIHNTNSTESE